VSHSSVKDLSDLPLLLTVQDLADLLHVGRNAAYEQCHRPGFPAVRIGKQLRIPRDALVRWLDTQTAPGTPQPTLVRRVG
jgi:excisionase family DNA binding protein